MSVGGRGQKTSEKKLKKRFFSFFSSIFQNYIKKIITYDALQWIASLVQISNQSDNIWGSYTQKTTLKQPKIHFSGLTKTFENSYLATTKPTPMKLTTIMYLHETFLLAENWGVTHRA